MTQTRQQIDSESPIPKDKFKHLCWYLSNIIRSMIMNNERSSKTLQKFAELTRSGVIFIISNPAC